MEDCWKLIIQSVTQLSTPVMLVMAAAFAMVDSALVTLARLRDEAMEDVWLEKAEVLAQLLPFETLLATETLV